MCLPSSDLEISWGRMPPDPPTLNTPTLVSPPAIKHFPTPLLLAFRHSIQCNMLYMHLHDCIYIGMPTPPPPPHTHRSENGRVRHVCQTSRLRSPLQTVPRGIPVEQTTKLTLTSPNSMSHTTLHNSTAYMWHLY